MFFHNVPESVQDFKKKEKNLYNFEKALEVIGLDSKGAFERLRSGIKAYEDLGTQTAKCQEGYVKYVQNRDFKARDDVIHRTIKLRGKKRIILKGRTQKPNERIPERTGATSSKPSKELEELVNALENQQYRTQKERISWEDRVDYLQKVAAREAIKTKGSAGREIKRNLPTPCPSCSGRRKKTTKTIQNILSGNEKGAWKN
jgi:hypothetical protein